MAGKLVVVCEGCQRQFRAGTELVGATKECPKCGHGIFIAPKAAPTIHRHCAECGAEMARGSRCPSCGEHYRQAREDQRERKAWAEDRQRLEKEYGWFARSLIGVTLLFVFGIAGTAFLLAKGKINRKVILAPVAATVVGGVLLAGRRRTARLARRRAEDSSASTDL